ncbi:hypothetical protein O181_094455 [Austropuccinia psidii MF-1]|uniref:Uncharacterized protein n=1 Tax=Austropuccinia psidii MF-1 TaxID=1389203 RepID=A0A9Q3J3Q5_9BASI|nr:hypothetical protein [Austropuccinia psidii MF-1]
MEDSRTSTSSQRLASIFDSFIESPEAYITSIPVVRSEELPTSSRRDITVSVQELVCGRKAEVVVTSSQIVDRDNELLPSSEGALGPRKDTRASEGVENYFL